MTIFERVSLSLFASLFLALLMSCQQETSLSRVYSGPSLSMPTGSPSIDADGLVASYDMQTLTEEGHLKDLSGNGHDGEFANQELIEGQFNKAKLFRSVSDRVHLPERPAFDLNGPFTLATRLRVDSLNLHQHIVACDDKWALWITHNNQFRIADTRGVGWSTMEQSVERGKWVSVIAVMRGTKGDTLNANNIEIFVDGLSAESIGQHFSATGESAGVWSPGELYAEDACYIGFESHQGEPYHQEMPFIGAVEELLLFSRALSDNEIKSFALVGSDK